ncbi:MAG TPA: hypothetical protein VJ696_13665 [Rhodanobacteraceae bacterium]|nr:hypothetical protein [Rhodanobacteraceae bacterium]
MTHPLPDAFRALANCVEHEAMELPGAAIAISERGTLLLNQRAWSLCGSMLEALPNLEATEASLEDAKPVRFLLEPP